MAINIGTTGTAGRFIGGGAGVYRNNALKLYIDPYRYDCFTAESDSSMEDLSGWGNNLTCANGATDFSNGYWYLDGSDDFAYRTDDSDFDFSTTTDFSIQMWYRNLGSGDFGLIDNLITKNNDSKFIYTGCQIINKKILSDYKDKNFSISNVWNDLIKKKELYGFETTKEFYHLTDLETFKKLQDL